MDKVAHKSNRQVLDTLRKLLAQHEAGTQKYLREKLEKKGFKVNQSTISRHLRKLGAIKMFESDGEAKYRLPSESSPPVINESIADLVYDISRNETLIIIRTSSGSASLIARSLKHFSPGRILGTIAGDDTVFVAVKTAKQIKGIMEDLEIFFGKC